MNADGTAVSSEITAYIASVKSLITTIKSSSNNVQVFVGTPSIGSNVAAKIEVISGTDNPKSTYTSTFNNVGTTFVNFINALKTSLGNDWSRVTGIYMAYEDMGPMYLNPNNMIIHPHYKLFKTVCDHTHSLGKSAIWAPYYETDLTASNIAKICHLTSLFNAVLIQPTLYFRNVNGFNEDNCALVKKCVQNQAIFGKANVRKYSSSSNSTIGVQMEVDSYILRFGGRGAGAAIDAASQQELIRRYQKYYNTFHPYNWQWNFGFFHEHKNCDSTPSTANAYFTQLQNNYVNPFYA